MSTGNHADQLLREYLISKGYSKTLQALENEAILTSLPTLSDEGGSEEQQLSSSSLSGFSILPKAPSLVQSLLSSTMEDIYVLGIKNGNGEQYQHEYHLFSAWVGSSLDLVQPYLQALAFPLLIQCYIGLIRFGLENQAGELLRTFKSPLEENFHEELQFLSLLRHHDQINQNDFLAQNPFIKAVLSEKFSVTMSTLAYSLLASFLDDHNLVLLAALLNEKIQLDVIHDDPRQSRDLIDITTLLSLPGYLSSKCGWHGGKLVLGVPGSGRALAAAQQIAPSLFQNIQSPDKNDAVMKVWLEKLVRPRAILNRHKKARIETPRKVSLQATQAALQASERDSQKLGNPLEPSIIFATIGNAEDNLISLSINESVSQAVAGGRDGVVRVWRLDHAHNALNPAFGQSLANTAFQWTMDEIAPKPLQAFKEEQIEQAKTALLLASEQTLRKQEATRYPCLELHGHSLPVYSVSQDSTERVIISSSADETIRLWDTAVMQCIAKYPTTAIPWAVAFHPLDYYFASGNSDRSVSLFATDRYQPLRILCGHTSDVNCVAWHGNGTLLASGGDDKSIRLWDIRKADCVRVLRGSTSPISSLTVSPLGSLLAAGTESGKIYLYDLQASRMLAILHGHNGTVNSLSFSADGLTLASGGKDCSVRIWNTIPALSSESASASSSSTATAAAQNSLSSAEQAIKGQLVLKPRHSFFSKSSPVFTVGYTSQNLLFAGGPCLSGLLSSQLSHHHNAVGESGSAMASEQEAAHLLGLSTPMPCNP